MISKQGNKPAFSPLKQYDTSTSATTSTVTSMITRKQNRMKGNIPVPRNMSDDIVPIQGSGYEIIYIQYSALV